MSRDLFTSFPGYTGWVPDEADDRDFNFTATYRPPWGIGQYLRSEANTTAKKNGFETEKYWNAIYDQGQTGSCTANAVAAAYSFALNRSRKAEGGSDAASYPSRSFIYYNARKGNQEDPEDDEQELVPDDGSQIRLAMRSLQRFGVCEDESWPLKAASVNWYPGPYAYFEAQRGMIRSYQYKRLDVKRWNSDRSAIIEKKDTATMDKDGDVVLYNLRSSISQGHPVVFGFRIYLDPDVGRFQFNQAEEGSSLSAFTRWYLPSVPQDRRHLGPPTQNGGHAVVAVGFVDGKKKARSGWVLCQNSWGENKEVPGAPFFWLPYDYITDFVATADFWMMDVSGFPSKL